MDIHVVAYHMIAIISTYLFSRFFQFLHSCIHWNTKGIPNNIVKIKVLLAQSNVYHFLPKTNIMKPKTE